MLLSRFKKSTSHDFVVIDPVFPQQEPLAFRNSEINEYFKLIKNFASYTMPPMLPGPEAWFSHGYGVDYEKFLENKQGYSRHYPENDKRIHYLDPQKAYNFKLAYSYFLAETYTLLPYFEKQKIPFVFVLYPGGAFGINNPKIDAMLRKIFQSPYFRHVIVTQQITLDYLLDKKLCPKDKITYIYGGFVQFKKSEVKPKQYYKQDKTTFDICFVAAKYSEKGVDKGYDLFIEVAKKLCKVTDDARFHVVGGFDESDMDVGDIGSRITFYGYKKPDFLVDFYAKMDIFLAPNRPFKLYKGNFDGFPLGIDAGYCGVALFVADELRMNHQYEQDKEIVIIPLEPKKIADTILAYYNDLAKLYALTKAGQARTQELFDIDHQISERIKVFSKYVDLKTRRPNQ
ncbi:MAG TPA: glycosyltransferase family 4 protein [Candidatus Saccharimonadales bacterium]|nr:glycosyltransferase family 4 protein [Candidatus Saccharimonadales bacterium]